MSEERAGPVTVDELAEKANEDLRETSLTPAEYGALTQSVAELTAIFEMLDDAGRLCGWSSPADLVECAEALT
jgi:hypothetical protein